MIAIDAKISGSNRYSIREFRFVAVQFRNGYLWRGYQIPLECMQSSPTSTLECLGSVTKKQRWTIAMSGLPTHPEQKPFYVQSRITMLCPLIYSALQVLQNAGWERNHLSWAMTSSSKPDIAFGTRLPLHPPQQCYPRNRTRIPLLHHRQLARCRLFQLRLLLGRQYITDP